MLTKLAGYFSGRHTMFLCANLAIGCTFAWFHRLDSNLVTLLLGLQTLVLAHSAKEDYFGNGQSR